MAKFETRAFPAKTCYALVRECMMTFFETDALHLFLCTCFIKFNISIKLFFPSVNISLRFSDEDHETTVKFHAPQKIGMNQFKCNEWYNDQNISFYLFIFRQPVILKYINVLGRTILKLIINFK